MNKVCWEGACICESTIAAPATIVPTPASTLQQQASIETTTHAMSGNIITITIFGNRMDSKVVSSLVSKKTCSSDTAAPERPWLVLPWFATYERTCRAS